eukprot:XP_001706194.1 Hypothetical protein GL50803_39094 [Giardia lamblia ATCC 50803]
MHEQQICSKGSMVAIPFCRSVTFEPDSGVLWHGLIRIVDRTVADEHEPMISGQGCFFSRKGLVHCRPIRLLLCVQQGVRGVIASTDTCVPVLVVIYEEIPCAIKRSARIGASS